MNNRFVRYTCLTFLIILSNPALVISEESEIENSKHWYDGIILDLGINLSQVDLIVERYENGSIVSEGTLSSEIDYSPFINIGSPYRFFGKTNFGYNIQVTYYSFNVDRQELKNDSDLEDHGTSASGYTIYGMPVFFYNVGDKYLKNGNGKFIKIGIGVGLGYFETDGDIILENTDDGSQENYSFDYSTDLIDIAAYVLMDFRFNKLLVRIRGGGPQSIKNEVNGYGFGLFDFSISMGYAFVL